LRGWLAQSNDVNKNLYVLDAEAIASYNFAI
jgi:hypothetical protein